jgi:hypothetical protein
LKKECISLYLTLCTKTPLKSLLTEGSFAALLSKESNFDVAGFNVITGLIAIINQYEEEKRM